MASSGSVEKEDSEPVAKKHKPTLSRATMQEDVDGSDGVDGESREVTYVEFYSGVGGWTMALHEALERVPQRNLKLHRLAALDHSDLCSKAFEHNFGPSSANNKASFAIEKLTKKQVEAWKANIWAMSPPCQPHTRQHSNQEADLKDPRSGSFLHLLDLLCNMDAGILPTLIVLENVVGFESSNSYEQWRKTLKKCDYHLCTFHLNPTQVQLPNDRPRCFCLALLRDRLLPVSKSPENPLTRYVNISNPERALMDIPELLVSEPVDSNSLPKIANFLDVPSQVDVSSLRVPEKVLNSKSSWCFDIVTPQSRRSSCFTHSYGRYNRGTGSILYADDSIELELKAPEDREYDEDWTKDLDLSKLRYFSGLEMGRLMGFSESFRFPPDYTHKQQWKLVGNSLNVRVASKVVELGFKLVQF